jgi:hypothetical protein
MPNPTIMPSSVIESAKCRSWHRQPILWLGALIFAASLGGCIVMIILGHRYADESLPIEGAEILKMPLTRH